MSRSWRAWARCPVLGCSRTPWAAQLDPVPASSSMRRVAAVIAIISALAAICPVAAAGKAHHRSPARNHTHQAARHGEKPRRTHQPGEHARTAPGRSARGTRSAQAGASLRKPETLAAGAGYLLPHGSPVVRALQRRLLAIGYPPGPTDGRFGPRTQAAVVRFQISQGLVPDGIVGPRTRDALAAPALGLGAGYGVPRGSMTVRRLQRRLVRLGFALGPVDGLYGPRTAHAVARFQAAHHLVVNGVDGPGTQFALLLIRRSSSLPPLQPLSQVPPLAQKPPASAARPRKAPHRARRRRSALAEHSASRARPAHLVADGRSGSRLRS